jgi:hypothetical protein
MTNNKPQDETIKDQIIALLEKGYKRDQLIKDFKFAERSVDAAIRVYKELHNSNTGEPKEDDAPIADDGASAPLSKNGRSKAGKSPPGGARPEGKGYELMKISTKDMIPPEQALMGIRLQDGEYKKGFVDGMGVLIMAARYNQILAASQAEIITGQLEIMKESRESGMEMAAAAAGEAAARATMHIDQRFDQLRQEKADIATVKDPMKGLMARTMETMMNRLTGMMFGQQPGQPGSTPGLVDERPQK